MNYKHPQNYAGIPFDTPNNQQRMKIKVENDCLRCSLFSGEDHDFTECFVGNRLVYCPQECKTPIPFFVGKEGEE